MCDQRASTNVVRNFFLCTINSGGIRVCYALHAGNGRGSRPWPRTEGRFGWVGFWCGAGTDMLCIAGAAPITAKPFKGPPYSAHRREVFCLSFLFFSLFPIELPELDHCPTPGETQN